MPHNPYPTRGSIILLLLSIVLISFALGGLGAWCGTAFIMFANNGECIEGPRAGYALLLTGMILAVPGSLLIRAAARALGSPAPGNGRRR